MPATQHNFCGETIWLDPAGVLVWPRLSLLAVADLHLEKGSACAAAGHLVPPWDSGVTLARLSGLIRRYAPQTVVAVGDSFHDGGAAGRLCADDRALLASLAESTGFVWVRGNHDPAPPAGIQGKSVAEFAVSGLVFRHQAAAGATGEISGHFHPKARVATRAAVVARPCFLCSEHRIMLPSFGAYTGGLEIGHPAIAEHFPQGARAFLLGRERVFAFAVAGWDAPPPLVMSPAPHRFG